MGATGDRRLKPLLAAAWSRGRCEVSGKSTLGVTVTSVLKRSHFCHRFPAKGKDGFSQGWVLVSVPETVGGCLGNGTTCTSHQRKGDGQEK